MADSDNAPARVPGATVLGFPVHQGRAPAIGEVHARPHPVLSAPRVLIQMSFMTEGGSGVDHAALAEIARAAENWDGKDPIR